MHGATGAYELNLNRLLDTDHGFALVQTGTFPDRPSDTIDFVVSNQNYASLGFANVRAARALQGLDPHDAATNQTMLELNYGIQLTPTGLAKRPGSL